MLSLAALSACGLRGDLVRPVPMWGDPPNEGPNDPRTLKAIEDQKAADRAAADAQKRADDEAARKAAEAQAAQPAPAVPPTP